MASATRTGYRCLHCRPRQELSTAIRKFVHTHQRPAPAKLSTKLRQSTKPNAGATPIRSLWGLSQPEKVDDPRYRTMPSGERYAFSDTPDNENMVLQPHNLFHSFSNSPIPEVRRRANYIKHHAYCPHPSHRQTRATFAPFDPEARKSPGSETMPAAHVKFECPDCGIPVACCEEHWADDYETHLEFCDVLKQINEDDHDLHSGRFFDEFHYPDDWIPEALINLSNWDTLLYTRQFKAVNDTRALRQVTRLLTYPTTIGSILHEFSPYSIKPGGRLTAEGLKSLTALHYNLHPDPDGRDGTMRNLRPTAPPVRIFVLGARGESSLPRSVWLQLSHMFPRARFHIIFIGPESMVGREREFPMPSQTPLNPFGAKVEDRLGAEVKISTFIGHYHSIHKTGYFAPFDPYFDCFLLFHPGLGHPASSHDWQETLSPLLKTKVPIICTGYTEWDMDRDLKWVDEQAKGEYDLLLEPGENRFRSLRWDLNDSEPYDVTCANWGVWAFRGKKYEATEKGAPSESLVVA